MFRTKVCMTGPNILEQAGHGDWGMVRAKFIGGDWGTTHLRLFLCGPELNALDQLEGPGAVHELLEAPFLQVTDLQHLL